MRATKVDAQTRGRQLHIRTAENWSVLQLSALLRSLDNFYILVDVLDKQASRGMERLRKRLKRGDWGLGTYHSPALDILEELRFPLGSYQDRLVVERINMSSAGEISVFGAANAIKEAREVARDVKFQLEHDQEMAAFAILREKEKLRH